LCFTFLTIGFTPSSPTFPFCTGAYVCHHILTSTTPFLLFLSLTGSVPQPFINPLPAPLTSLSNVHRPDPPLPIFFWEHLTFQSPRPHCPTHIYALQVACLIFKNCTYIHTSLSNSCLRWE
jgi:hypothetical protein